MVGKGIFARLFDSWHHPLLLLFSVAPLDPRRSFVLLHSSCAASMDILKTSYSKPTVSRGLPSACAFIFAWRIPEFQVFLVVDTYPFYTTIQTSDDNSTLRGNFADLLSVLVRSVPCCCRCYCCSPRMFPSVVQSRPLLPKPAQLAAAILPINLVRRLHVIGYNSRPAYTSRI